MSLLWKRRAKAVHHYSRESVTAIPRIRAAVKLQAWRAGDGEAARPIYLPSPALLDPVPPRVLALAA
jgi:hypothetical protein